MATAYILINTEVGYENNVRQQLVTINGIKDLTVVYGLYDIIIKIEQPTIKDLKALIFSKIRKLEHVKSTITLVGIEKADEIP
ncbi:MAG: Lrp/AsnC ligand binding domain-containing protein [Candidatus Hermodarchaeota archaeon]